MVVPACFVASSQKENQRNLRKKVFQTILYLILSNAFGMWTRSFLEPFPELKIDRPLRGKRGNVRRDFMASMQALFPWKCPRFPFCVPAPFLRLIPFTRLKVLASSKTERAIHCSTALTKLLVFFGRGPGYLPLSSPRRCMTLSWAPRNPQLYLILHFYVT